MIYVLLVFLIILFAIFNYFFWTSSKNNQKLIFNKDALEKEYNNFQQEVENKKDIAEEELNSYLLNLEIERQNQKKQYEEQFLSDQAEHMLAIKSYSDQIDEIKAKYDSLIEGYKTYYKDKEEDFFCTVQIPEQYREDISYLLNNVLDKIQHPDILNKLIWQEYVKPYLDETFKRLNITSSSGDSWISLNIQCRTLIWTTQKRTETS